MKSKTTLALTKYVPLAVLGGIVVLAFGGRFNDPDILAYEKIRDARAPQVIHLSQEQREIVAPMGNAAALVTLPGGITGSHALLCVSFGNSGVTSQLVRMESGNPESVNNHRVGALIRTDQPCGHVRGLSFEELS